MSVRSIYSPFLRMQVAMPFFALAAASIAILVTVLLLGAAGNAQAADDPNMPWIVTRKADNRVLPKQDSVADIEKGLATPEKAMDGKKNDEAGAENSAAEMDKQPEPKPQADKTQVGTPVAQTNAAAVSGQVSAPKVSVSANEIVIMLPTTTTVTDTRYLNLDNPRRVALDVMGSWKYSGKKKFAVNKGALEKMEIGKHSDFIRIVLHLTKGAVPKEIVPRFQLVEGGLKMTVPLAN